jgi:predicted DCC family thiol-disulfide oxidoreductase YuxK
MKETSYPVVLFDGVCNLCNGIVKFSLRRDRKGILRFASLQSEAAKDLLRSHDIDENQMDTFVFVESGKAYTRSTAGLKLFKSFGFPWSILYVLIIIPRSIRDALYNFIAQNRYRWFGKEESCMIPSPEVRARFLG